MKNEFKLAGTPHLHFGAGAIAALPAAVKQFGTSVLLVTGARSFMDSPQGHRLLDQFEANSLTVSHTTVPREPSPAMIDSAVRQFSSFSPAVVVAIGGGSAVDAGKAISAMMPLGEPVKHYLEGVGTGLHPGLKVPFIAVPTTAGTGSEATKNAVLSETGAGGYKRSLRHDRFVPDVAIVDPVLATGCPPPVTAASGMDAFTQLLESYLSPMANPFTDALACEGLRQVARSLPRAYRAGDDLEARNGMSLAAYLSGITLANAGLGLVHGMASAIGGFFDIPHGVICSALMPAANAVTVRRLRAGSPDTRALLKYAAAGKLFSGTPGTRDDYDTDALLALIQRWVEEMNIPRLGTFGITAADFSKIVQHSSNKNNPVALSQDEIYEVLERSS